MKSKDFKPVWALGTMSGTSLDGVDAALLKTDGETIHAFGETGYRPYTDDERRVLRAAQGLWHDDDIAAATEVVEVAHRAVIEELPTPSVVGFHGQTVAHDPKGRGTHQLGCGEALSAALGVPVVWDFRSADVALGGEGAPLAPFYHHACARHLALQAPVVFLNLGGVGNLSWVDPRIPAPETQGAVLAFDTGPANAPLNDLMQSRLGQAFDRDGALAATGSVDASVIETFLSDPYFLRMPPKSLDRGAFGAACAAASGLAPADAAATLTAMAALAVGEAMAHCPAPPDRVLVTGGGRHNAVMMRMLAAGLDCPVEPVEAVGLDGDMLEAQAFAYLAVRVLRGLPTTAPATTGVATCVGGGQIARP